MLEEFTASLIMSRPAGAPAPGCPPTMAVAFQEVEASLVDIQGVFATLYLAGLANRIGLGLGRPGQSAATQLVCALVPTKPGPSDLVFATHQAAGLRG
jgi:hypothetical protein